MRIKKINESILDEATLGQVAQEDPTAAETIKKDPTAKKIATKFETIGGVEYAAWSGAKGEVEEALDRALRNANRIQKKNSKNGTDRVSGDNVLLVGRAGTGKTERIKNWAKQRGLDLEQYQVQSLDPTDLAGIIGRDDSDPEYAQRLGNKEFHRLDNPNAVLFLDEINRASEAVLGSLLTLVQNHKIVDPKGPNGMRTLPFKFTVAAMNPPSIEYDVTELDMAMQTRFKFYQVEADNEFQKMFYDDYFKKEIRENRDDPEELMILKGQAAIANTLMSSEQFYWDDEREEHEAHENGFPALNPRTLSQCLWDCDGTKEDFLDLFVHTCNPAKLQMVEDILEDYEDVDDEANSVFQKYENPFAAKRENNLDKLNKYRGV